MVLQNEHVRAERTQLLKRVADIEAELKGARQELEEGAAAPKAGVVGLHVSVVAAPRVAVVQVDVDSAGNSVVQSRLQSRPQSRMEPFRLQSRPQSQAAQSRPRAAETVDDSTQTDARQEEAAPAPMEGAEATERVAGAEAKQLPAPSPAAPDPAVDLEAAAALIQGAAASAGPNPAGPALDPEQQQRETERELRSKNLTLSLSQQQQLAERLEALSEALDVGALSPALYEQARRELVRR